MIQYKENVIQINYKDMGELADVIADLNRSGYDLIHNGKENYWAIVNPEQTKRFIIEKEYQGISELRDLTKKELLFLLEE